ncbi:hypothetical protein G205_08088 [Arthrobacter nitrophenolicus]|uniref:Uncharacterized protein n=1 Tax=Arthrobacter nitrophenolicus TaxID=683150 RepID=L8TQI0_9MICC|nr:hypothetical protein G205_08088 [Arthrobacter nitrophenolicus]
MPVMDRAEAFKDLHHRLVEFRLTGVARQDGVPNGLQPCIHELLPCLFSGAPAAPAAPARIKVDTSTYKIMTGGL